MNKMNKRQQEQFIYFFDELCEMEEVIDHLKVDLTHHQGYNPHLLFQQISGGYEQISIQRMRRYLNDKIACNHRQLYEIFQRFDSKRQGYVSRADFIRQMKPLKKKHNFEQGNGQLTVKIQSSFIEIFIQILKKFRIIQESRKQVGLIQPYDAFAHLDYWKKGIIGLGQLKKFYQDNDFQIGAQSLDFLLHALRRRYYRDVNMELFCQNLNPLQFGQYPKFTQQIIRQNERQFLKRSRSQDQQFRRSRMDNQILQYQAQRVDRRKRAQVERHFDLEQRINLELADYDKVRQNNIRRALIEDQRNIRSRAVIQQSFQERDNFRVLSENRRTNQAQALRERQIIANEELQKQIVIKQAKLEAERRIAIQQSELAAKEEFERQREAHRLLMKARQMQMNKMRQQSDSVIQRQIRMRHIQMQRLRSLQRDASLSRTIKQSRVQDLQYELQKTRAQMRQRRNQLQLQEKLRYQQTSAKSRLGGYFH